MGQGIYGLGWDNRTAQVIWRCRATILLLSSASHPQAEKHEDNIPQNNGELAVRAKLVLPAGPRKLQEAREG